MTNYTPNYNLKKPSQEEHYNIDDFNNNFDIIDGKLKESNDSIIKISTEITDKASDTDLFNHIETNASIMAKGHVKLNNTVTSTSITEAATANSVKSVNDKVSEIVNSNFISLSSLRNALEEKVRPFNILRIIGLFDINVFFIAGDYIFCIDNMEGDIIYKMTLDGEEVANAQLTEADLSKSSYVFTIDDGFYAFSVDKKSFLKYNLNLELLSRTVLPTSFWNSQLVPMHLGSGEFFVDELENISYCSEDGRFITIDNQGKILNNILLPMESKPLKGTCIITKDSKGNFYVALGWILTSLFKINKDGQIVFATNGLITNTHILLDKKEEYIYIATSTSLLKLDMNGNVIFKEYLFTYNSGGLNYLEEGVSSLFYYKEYSIVEVDKQTGLIIEENPMPSNPEVKIDSTTTVTSMSYRLNNRRYRSCKDSDGNVYGVLDYKTIVKFPKRYSINFEKLLQLNA